MLSIAIYSENSEVCNQLKEIIQDYLIENKAMARVSMFNKVEEIEIASHSYDLYIIDMDGQIDAIELGIKLSDIEKGRKFIYIADDINKAFQVTAILADGFLPKPVPAKNLKRIISKIQSLIKNNCVVIQTAIGERRVDINNINYIHIVKRCLCYHLTDNSIFDGQTLRTSFEKATSNLINNENFVFIDPSLLINLGQIKILERDHIIFENDEKVYFPKKHYDLIREKWINYSKVLE